MKTTEATTPTIVSKPWGYELIIANNDIYCSKKLVIPRGQSTSLHYHRAKDETFFIQAGRSVVYYCDEPKLIPPALKNNLLNPEVYAVLKEIKLNKGDVFHLPPGRVHQIFALEDLEIIEVSTKYIENDTVRFYCDRRG